MGFKAMKKIPPIPPSQTIVGKVPTAYRNRLLHQSSFGNTIQCLPTFIQQTEVKQRPPSSNTKLRNVVATLLSEPQKKYRNELFEACLKQSMLGTLSDVLESLEAVKDALEDVKELMKQNSEEGGKPENENVMQQEIIEVPPKKN